MKHRFSDVPSFRRDPLGFVCRRSREDAQPLARMHLGFTPIYLVNDPTLVKPILKSEEATIGKGAIIAKLRPILGDGTLTMSGPEHRRRREVLHRLLARGTVERLVPELAAEIVTAAVNAVRAGIVDAGQFGRLLALRLICVAVFGRNVLSDEDEQTVVSSIRSVEDDFADDMFRVLPLSPWKKLRRGRMRYQVRETMLTIVSRLRHRAAGTSAMRILADAGLTDAELCDEVITLLIAGHHTVGTTLGWALYHLAREPALAEEIRAETEASVNSSGEIDAGRMRAARVSAAFVQEVLRLYPGAWWFVREAQTTTEVAGVHLKKGAVLFFSPWAMHRDERYWEEPDTFRIDRDYASPAFIPFGAGPRACIGIRLAMLEIQLVVMEFAAAMSLEDATSGALQPRASVTLQPPEIKIAVRACDVRLAKSDAA